MIRHADATGAVDAQVQTNDGLVVTVGRSFTSILCVFVGLAAPIAVAASRLDPKSFVLEIQDLPTGYKGHGKYLSRHSAAVAYVNTPNKPELTKGFVASYDASYVRGRLASYESIDSFASVWKTSSDASAFLTAARKGCGPKVVHLMTLSVKGAFGGTASLCGLLGKGGHLRVGVFQLAWQQGRIASVVIFASLHGAAARAQEITLAEQQAARIELETFTQSPRDARSGVPGATATTTSTGSLAA